MEISMVMVIIALLTGVIMAAQGMIDAARARGIIKELNFYQQAVASFKGKYGEMPGDMLQAGKYWPTYTWPSSSNGDGFIVWLKEGECAWQQLSLSGMIPGGSVSTTACAIDTAADPGANIPKSLQVTTAGWTLDLNTDTYKNVLIYGKEQATPTTKIANDAAITGNDAYAIDNKIDDGAPTLGEVRAQAHTGTCCSDTTCTPNATGITYMLTNELLCSFDANLGL